MLVVPVAPADVSGTLGPWLAKHVTTKRNMVRFLLPKAGLPCIYDDPDLRRISRCAYLAKSWKDNEPVYVDIFRRFDKDMRRELSERFDRFSAAASLEFPAARNVHLLHRTVCYRRRQDGQGGRRKRPSQFLRP